MVVGQRGEMLGHTDDAGHRCRQPLAISRSQIEVPTAADPIGRILTDCSCQELSVDKHGRVVAEIPRGVAILGSRTGAGKAACTNLTTAPIVARLLPAKAGREHDEAVWRLAAGSRSLSPVRLVHQDAGKSRVVDFGLKWSLGKLIEFNIPRHHDLFVFVDVAALDRAGPDVALLDLSQAARLLDSRNDPAVDFVATKIPLAGRLPSRQASGVGKLKQLLSRKAETVDQLLDRHHIIGNQCAPSGSDLDVALSRAGDVSRYHSVRGKTWLSLALPQRVDGHELAGTARYAKFTRCVDERIKTRRLGISASYGFESARQRCRVVPGVPQTTIEPERPDLPEGGRIGRPG